MNLKEKIASLPTKPGVYFFKNQQGEIIYIGKGKNLRNRVRSYFQKNKYQTPKNQSLIARIADLEWLVVRSEVEALLTEANLIKEHQPHYNISLKDDKSFPFIRITSEPFPRVFITREIVKDGSKYFGPYTDVLLLRRSLKAVHKIFPVRSCDYHLDEQVVAARKVRLCLDYHIKKCEGPCEGLVSQEVYGQMIKRVIQFLQGKTGITETYIREQMELAAAELRFEDAAMYRDQLRAIKSFRQRQRKVVADFADRDVFALAREEGYGTGVIVRIRSGRIFSREKIYFKKADEEIGKLLETLMTRFYLHADFIPPEILTPDFPDNREQIEKWLREKRRSVVKIHVPQRGEKARELRLAEQNAKLLLGEWLLERKKRKELVPKMVAQLQDDLQLKAPPRRIEAFDISHLGGTQTVASMVCFIDGKPRKSQYRKFKIKTITGIDDFASIREVVFRRYKRVKKEQGSYPDLILIDGGKGQLSMAVSALRELGLDYLPMVGLAKRLEEVFVPGESAPRSLAKQSPGLILLRRIRDEAHRFAITFQRQKRGKKALESIFSTIPGIGLKRLQKLLTEFNSVEEIASANVKDIQEKVSVDSNIAEQILKKAKK
ncbi:MAG: excinuclease ABC subunit UvrC [Fidelibacterota bacterium]